MKFCLITALVFGSMALSVPSVCAQQSGVQSAAEREIRRQEQLKTYAESAIAKGQAAYATKDYESAFAFYKSALDVLPSGGPATSEIRAAALQGYSQAAVQLAQQRISEGRFEDATVTINAVLDERYNPNYGPALALQAKLKSPTTFNKTMSPTFIANVEEVKQLLSEAQGFYDSGRFDLAFKRYEQVLNIDRYNIAARRGQELVNGQRDKYATAAYSETRSDMIREVDKAWELPVRRFEVGQSAIIEQPQLDTRGTSAINRKLDEIILPSIDFNDATIREALDFIKQRAAARDLTEQDPTRRGVNIVLKLAPDAPEANQRITLSLQDTPLRAVLDYVARAASMKLKIEPYAVAVVPQSEPTDILITKEYKVPPSFITALPAPAGGGATAGGGGTTAPGSLPSIQERSGARQYLESQGVDFPPGASANFLAGSSKLIVKNTQANLDIIDTLVESSLTAPPSQVQIQSKFLEITQNNLKELGFDWLVGQFALPGGTGVYGSGGTMGLNRTINGASYPFSNPNGTPVGASSTTAGPVTAGNRSGTSAISVNAVDALLFGTPAGVAPGVLSVAGVFSNPQFQVVLRALNQSKGVDLVTAPMVTTRTGQRAIIEIVREFRYPTEFELPQVTSTAGSVLTPATPTTPTAFETKPVGITLEVEPTVGPDGYTIDLVLSPRVVEFDGFINYGSPINVTVTVFNAIGILSTSISDTVTLTDNVINQPVFSTREVTTQVSVYDGQTVVMGGLMREDVQKTEDKVPIIGDIPFAGRLFRTTTEQHIKRNLIMFVTANLMDPAGQPLIKVDEEDEIVAVPSAEGVEEEAIPGDPSTIPISQ